MEKKERSLIANWYKYFLLNCTGQSCGSVIESSVNVKTKTIYKVSKDKNRQKKKEK